MRYFDLESLKNKALRLYEKGKVQAAYLRNDETLFPLRLRFGKIGEREIRTDFARIQKEIQELQRSKMPLEYKTFRFASIGEQCLPVAVVFSSLEVYLGQLGLEKRFEIFVRKSSMILEVFPSLHSLLVEKPKLIEDYSEDWERIVAVCRYITKHPNPRIYLRQLPIEGVDTKFIDTRKKVIDLVLGYLLPKEAYDADVKSLSNGGFERKYGFLTPQPMIRFRLLDPECYIANQEEMALPEEAFANLELEEIERVFIVENLATYLAFFPFKKSMVIFGSGYGARYLKRAKWLKKKHLYYWGDLDSHGFAILSQFRKSFEHVESLLMDRETVERFVHLGVEEPRQKRFEGELEGLTKEEKELFTELRQKGFRLEQERIPLVHVQECLAKNITDHFCR